MTNRHDLDNSFGKKSVTLPNGEIKEISGLLEELHIEIVEAMNLPQMDVSYDPTDLNVSATCDAYAVVRFSTEVKKTKIVKSTLNPKFEEMFTFTISNPGNIREEVLRLMGDLSALHIELFDHDDDGSAEFIGCQTLCVESLRGKKDGRYPCLDLILDLENRLGVEEVAVPRGKIRIRAAIRQGKQCEILARIRGNGWLNDSSVMQALESIPSFFSVGDPEVVTSLIRLLDNRLVNPLCLAAADLRMLEEVGIPLGISSRALEHQKGLLGSRLLTMIEKGIPVIAAAADDPRDIQFRTISTHWRARLLAVKALSLIAVRGDKGAVLASLDLISDENADVRTSAVAALGQLSLQDDLKVLPSLIQCIADDNICVREAAVLALRSVSTLNDRRTITDICAHLDDERDGIRSAATAALIATCTVGFSVAIIEVSARLESPSQCVRESAASAMNLVAGMGNKTAIAEIINRLQHPVRSVRLCALQALSTCSKKGNKFTIAALANLLEHPDWNVRQSAVEGIVAHSNFGDLAVIYAVAQRIKIDIDSPTVIEGATFVSVPSTSAELKSQFNTLEFQDDLPDSQFVFTPRLPSMMPLRRELYTSLHVPLLPADSQEASIAHMWWRVKCAADRVRHRYECFGRQIGPDFRKRSDSVVCNCKSHETSITELPQVHEFQTSSIVEELQSARIVVLKYCQKLLSLSKYSADDLSPEAVVFSKSLKILLKGDRALAQTWNWKRLFPINLADNRGETIDFTLAFRILQLHKRERIKLESVVCQLRKQMALNIKLTPTNHVLGSLSQGSTSFTVSPDDMPGNIAQEIEVVKSWACSGTLSIRIMDAKNLPSVSNFGSCDSYVKIEIDSKSDVKHIRTFIRLQSSDPVWNQKFDFPIDENFVKSNLKQIKQPKDIEDLVIPGIVESRVGLYLDLKLSIPLTPEEWNTSKAGLLIKVIADVASVHESQVWILVATRVSSRELTLIIRIVTSNFFKTLAFLGNVSEKDFGIQIESAGFVDQRHLLEVCAEYLISADELLLCSSLVTTSIWHNNLSSDDVLIGKVVLPLVPLVFSVIAQGNRLELCFDMTEVGLPIPQNDFSDAQTCLIRLAFQFSPQEIFSKSAGLGHVNPASERARLFLSKAIRRCAIETLVMVCGNAVEFTVSEIMRAFEKQSPRVHNAAREALRSISNSGHAMGCTKVLISAENNWIVSSSLDSTIKVWNLHSGKVLHTFRCHNGPVHSIIFHPVRSTMLISVGVDGLLFIHDVKNMERVFSARICRGNIKLLDIATDGSSFIISQGTAESSSGASARRQSEIISIWRLKWPLQNNAVETYKSNDTAVLLAQALAGCHHHSKFDQRFEDAYRSLERMVLSGCSVTSAISVLPQKSGFDPFSDEWKELAESSLQHIYECIDAGKQPDAPVWSRALILRIRRELSIPQVTKVGMTASSIGKGPVTVDYVGDVILGMEFDPHDSSKFATCASDGKVRIWKSMDPKSHNLTSAMEVVTEQWSDNSIQLFKQFRAHLSPVYAIAFHPLYRDILFTVGQTVKAWNLLGSAVCVGQLAFLHRPGSVFGTAICAARSLLAGGNDAGDIVVWGLDSSRLLAHSPVSSRTDMTRLNLAGNVRIRLMCHSGPVTSLSLDCGGSNSFGVSASQDRTVAIWSTKTGELMHLLTGDSRYCAGQAGTRFCCCLDPIFRALESPDDGVRLAVASCLPEAAERGDSAVVLQLILRLGSDREDVREAALLALEALAVPGDTTAIVAVAAHLMSPSAAKQETAVRAIRLVLAGEEETLDVLVQLSRRLCATRRSSAETFATVAAEVFLRATERIDLSDEV